MKSEYRITTKKYSVIAIPAALILFSTTLLANDTDTVDELIDDSRESEALAEESGQWLPVPMIVSNPTVGTAVQATILYMHPKKAGTALNTTTALVGMYSDTDSWFTGLFHDDSFMNDDVRLTGFLGTGHFNFKFYGIGANSILDDNSIPYEFDLTALMTKIQKRIPGSQHWFAGLKYTYMDSDTTILIPEEIPDVPDIGITSKTGGLGLLFTYDARDNNYYPTSGQWFETNWISYGETWGSDTEFSKATTFFNHYQPIVDNVVLALRTRVESAYGDAPFYSLPTLHMSGFSRDRYRDEHTISFHAEGRYKFRPRWGVIGFYEFGWFNEDFSNIFSGRRITSYGAGLRWQVSDEQSMHLGVDAAFSTDDSAIYINIGERF